MKEMDTVKITKAPSGGAIKAIISKSAAHRLLIAGFLSGIDIRDYCANISDDIEATRECLLAMKNPSGSCELPCRESGSTLRFLMPLAGALGIECDFLCKGRLADRPIEPLTDCLSEHGCKVSGVNPKHLAGKLTPGTFILPGDISSQYVTGLLMALPLLDGDSEIIIEDRLQSRPYVDMTLDVLRKAGVAITEGGNKFHVPGRQKYALPDYELENIEGDWSSATIWIAMDAMMRMSDAGTKPAGTRTGHIECAGLDPQSLHGDRAIEGIAERIIEAGERTLDIDVSDTPDLVPALAVLACGRPEGSVTNILNAGRLRYKESDRLRAVADVLAKLGADITEEQDSLTIRSAGKLRSGEVDSFGDHRIIMMAAAATCIADGPVTIHEASAVTKSYPGFFEDYQKLGGELQWL